MMAFQARARGGLEQLGYEPPPVPTARPVDALIAAVAALGRRRHRPGWVMK